MSRNLIKKSMKHVKTFLVSLAFIGLSLSAVKAQVTIVDQGTIGSLTWVLTSDSVLTVSGNGAIPDYGWGDSPWFSHNHFIATIAIGSDVTGIGERAFEQCNNLISITIPENIASIGNLAFQNCGNLGTVNFNAIACATMGSGIFDNINTLNIGEMVENIPASAFLDYNIGTVNFNAINCTTVGNGSGGAFGQSISALNIGNRVKSIPNRIFSGCGFLTPLIIPDSIISIGDYAFASCKMLPYIESYALIPPILGLNAFEMVIHQPVYVLCQVKDDYINAPGWGDHFTNIRSFGIPPKQELCMISVDENNHNEIVWKVQDAVNSYNIYREGTQTDDYILVANVDYNSQNRWVDTASDASVRSYRYKVSALDGDCDEEGELSEPHKTMHLTINAGTSNNIWNLIWTAYNGVSFQTYNILRSVDGSSFENIGSMASGGNTSFTDNNAPVGNIYYVVEIVLNNPCVLHKSLSSIKSNIASNDPVGISETQAEKIKIYPNPTSGTLRIESGDLQIENIQILDIAGKTIQQFNDTKTINVSQLSSGIYFVKLRTDKGELTKKVIKE